MGDCFTDILIASAFKTSHTSPYTSVIKLFARRFTKATWLQRPEVDGGQLRSHRSNEILN